MRLFTDASASIDVQYLRHAFRLAERGRGTTAPNPMVGCVVVSDGRIVGEGFHERAGGPHAEVVALAAAGPRALGAEVYVTLEPCSHHGATPPCTDALIDAKVARVVIGMPDPTPVAGGGADALRRAGIDVVFSADPRPYEQLNEAWLKRVKTGLPWVRVKVALTLDGRLALAQGVRSAISGHGGAEITMRLRAAADAVCVGARTALVDQPSLTVRDASGIDTARQPVRVVLARNDVPDSLAIFDDGRGPVVILCHGGVKPRVASEQVTVIAYDEHEGLCGSLRALASRGVDHVLVEAGSSLLTSLWDECCIDELVLVHAGGMGGRGAQSIYLGAGPEDTSRLIRPMHAIESGVAGDDAVTVWRLGERQEAVAGQEGR